MRWVKAIGSLGLGSCTLYGITIIRERTQRAADPSRTRLDRRLPAGEESENILDGMKLKSVQVFFRHGARTPLTPSLPNVEEDVYDKDWLLYTLPHTDFSLKITTVQGGPQPIQKYDNKTKKVIFKGGSPAGMLTTLGQDQALNLGHQLRNRYIDKLGLIDRKYNPQHIRVHSTNVERTIHSAQCALAGLFNIKDLRHKGPVHLYVKLPEEETLHPNFINCQTMLENGRKTLKQRHNIPRYKEVTEKVKSLLGADLVRGMGSVNEHLTSREAHGQPIPQGLRDLWPEIQEAALISVHISMCGMPDDEHKVLPVSVGPLLHEVETNMNATCKPEMTCRMFLNSCHDSTLVPLLAALQAPPSHWPPYCANLAFELWEDKTGQHWVNLKYCGKDLIPKMHSESVMTLGDFKKLISPYSLDESQYKQKCVDFASDIRDAYHMIQPGDKMIL